MKKLMALFVMVAVLVVSSPARAADPVVAKAPPAPGALKVLFVGNSLTGTNDLPATIEAMAKVRNKPFYRDWSMLPGRPLKEHWEDTRKRTLKMIQSQKWDIVVLQDHSGAPIDEPEDMVKYGTLLADEVIKQGAKPAWFMTWAGSMHAKDQPIFTKAYSDLSVATHGILVPVGSAWSLFKGDDRKALFPGSDQKHPSAAGTYLSACVFYGVLFHESPVGLPGKLDFTMFNGKPSKINFDDAQAKLYQEAAWAAVQTLGNR